VMDLASLSSDSPSSSTRSPRGPPAARSRARVLGARCA